MVDSRFYPITKRLRALFIAIGCNPPLCHACGEEMKVGQRYGGSRRTSVRYFVHEGCVETPEADFKIPWDEEIYQRVKAAIAEAGGLDAILDAPETTKPLIPTHGPFIPVHVVQAWLDAGGTL